MATSKDVKSVTYGRGFYIYFTGLPEKPGQFSIVSDDENPLIGKDIKYAQEVITPYGVNLWFEPVPFEMLKTLEQKPQVIVNVNGLPAVCHSLACDFAYTENVGKVTGFTYDAASKKVTITGTDLPKTADDIQKVDFAMTECAVNA
jgi:YD repeat-containing protein